MVTPYGKQTISTSDIRAVVRVLRSEFLTTGPAVPQFERRLAFHTGAKFAVAVSSGTAALHLAYLAADIKAGDEVITPPNTFVATSNMLLVLGARPVFSDIRDDTYTLDAEKIPSVLTRKTKAVIPVHFAGQPCDMAAIWRIARAKKLTVIEDAAHALGARYKNKPIGKGHSDMVVFSFHPIKSITTGEGGAIVTNNSGLYKKMLLLRNHGISKNKNSFNVMTALGYNYRMSDIHAALGLSQMRRLNEFIRVRREKSLLYTRLLADLDAIVLPCVRDDRTSSWHLYVIRTKNPLHRLPLYRYLRSMGVLANFHYPPVYAHPYYRKRAKRHRPLPVMEEYAKTALTLPLYPTLSDDKIRTIARLIKKFFFNYGRAN